MSNQSSLEQLLGTVDNPVKMLRNSRLGAYVYPVVPSEFSNWRDEQRAWRDSAVLFDQTHHMAEMTVKGPDALKLMSYLTINSFASFSPGNAKQMVPLSYDGYVIGDVLTLVWGEENGGTRKTTVERHKQVEVRVKVCSVPYARDAREGYHEGWRTRQS